MTDEVFRLDGMENDIEADISASFCNDGIVYFECEDGYYNCSRTLTPQDIIKAKQYFDILYQKEFHDINFEKGILGSDFLLNGWVWEDDWFIYTIWGTHDKKMREYVEFLIEHCHRETKVLWEEEQVKVYVERRKNDYEELNE